MVDRLAGLAIGNVVKRFCRHFTMHSCDISWSIVVATRNDLDYFVVRVPVWKSI